MKYENSKQETYKNISCPACSSANLIKRGFRKTFAAGYLITSVIAVIAFFVNVPLYVLLLLVAASVGTAMLEPTTEAYFFSVLKRREDEPKFYGPHNTALDVGQFIGKMSLAAILLILPFKFVFLVMGLFMFILFLISLKARNHPKVFRRRIKSHPEDYVDK